MNSCMSIKPDPRHVQTSFHSRREFLEKAGGGFGLLALLAMMEDDRLLAATTATDPLAPKTPPLPAKAKSVIYLFMHGGASHVDTFDPKPELTRRTGQPLSVELARTIKT